MKRFKKLLSMILAIVMVVGAVNLPAKEVKAAEKVTLGFESGHVRDANKDFLIYLTGLTADQVNALGDAGVTVSTINIDGKKCGGYGYNLGGKLAILVNWEYFDGLETAVTDVGRHFVTIPKGATIGSNAEYTVAEDFTLFIDGSASTKVSVVEKFVSLGYKSTSDRGADFLNYLTGFTAAELDAIGTNGMGHDFATGDLLVDGVATSEPYLWNLGSGNLALIVNDEHLDSDATSTSEVTEEHLVTIRKGAKIKSNTVTYTVDRDLTLRLGGGKAEWVNPSDAEPTLSIAAIRTDVLMLKADEIDTPPADVAFEAVDSNSAYLYNGEASKYSMIYSKHGGIYAEVAGMTGSSKTAPDKGDMITIKGCWRYLGDRKIYDFGTTNYSWNGEEWIEGVYVDAETPTLTIEANRTDLLMLAIEGVTTPTNDTKFEAVDENSVYLYNGVATSYNLTYAKWGGIYADTYQLSGKGEPGAGTPDLGDTITIGGLWKYLGNGKYYDFGTTSYIWNGSAWAKAINIETDAIVPTLTIAANRSDLLMLAIEGVTTPSGTDLKFEAYDANSIYLYNGEKSLYDMTYSRWGGIYADAGYMRGDMSHTTSYVNAVDGDTITIGGVWKYTGDGKYYNFGTTTYEWNESESKWEVQPTPLTLTESHVVDRPGSNDWMFYMTPSFEIDDSLFGNAGHMYLGVCQPIVTVGTTVTTATNSEIYIFPGNDDVGVTIKRTFLSGTPTAGTTVTFPAGMRITYNNVVYRTTEAFVWRYNGSSWVEKSDTYTPTLSAGSNAETTGVYLTSDDDMPYDTNWQLNYTAKDSESGVWVNGSRTEVFLKKIDATQWYVCLQDKSIFATRGTSVAVKGTFVNGENTITFEETTYIYDGAKWCTGSTLDTDFAITEMGDSTYQAGLGWKLRFVTDSVVYGEDFVTDLGTYTIQVDGVDTQVNCTSTGAPGYGLGILVEDLAQNPQGTIVTVPAGQIGEYTLTNTYEIIYDAGEWKLAHETQNVTLSFSHKMGGTNNLVFHHSEDLTALLTKGQTFKATYADSGIYVNGVKAKDAGIFWWTETTDGVITSSYFVVDHGSIATNRGDIVTVRGTFNLGEIYLNFSEASCRFVNDTSWVTSCNYESVQQVFVTDIASGAWQETYSRWLFTASTSTPLEHDSAEFTTPFSPKELIVTITDKDGNATTLYELPAYNANNADKTAANYLGFVIEETLGLPQDATGWSITIEPCYLQTTEKTYKIMSSFTYKYDSNTGFWKVESEREKPASGVFADANGDSKFNAADLVSALKEYEGRLTADSKKYLCAPDALIAGKTTVQLSDTIRIREELLDRSYLTPTTEAYIPVYLDDEEIQLGAYKGPRAISEDRRYDDDGNQLTDGVDYTRTGFLTDEMFKWYADAGLNTLISEGDAPFNSEGDYGMKAAAGYWTNLVSYMNLANKYDLDVYVLSGATTAYLRNNTVQTATNSGTEENVEISTEDMQNDLREMLTGVGSESHPTYGLLSFDNFKGIMLADELIEEYLPNYLTVNQYLATIAPDIEVTSAALSAKAEGDEDLITTNYENYATKYAQYSMNKDFLYDFYPYQGDAEESGFLMGKEYDYDPANAKTDSTWLDKLEGSAVRAANGGWTTGIAIQSYAMNHHILHKVWRSPSEKRDIGFQVYTALAYGMKSFNYFTYWEHDRQDSEGEVHTDSMVYIDSNNQPQRTDIYYAVQAVNKEITQFDHVYLDYDWQSTINIGSSDLFGSLTQGSSSRIASSSATEEAIIGCMYDDQKDLDGFWIVNATIPEDNLSNTVTVKFNNATRAMVFNPATGTYGDIINLTNQTYTANLASGEGQFVIPLP